MSFLFWWQFLVLNILRFRSLRLLSPSMIRSLERVFSRFLLFGLSGWMCTGRRWQRLRRWLCCPWTSWWNFSCVRWFTAESRITGLLLFAEVNQQLTRTRVRLCESSQERFLEKKNLTNWQSQQKTLKFARDDRCLLYLLTIVKITLVLPERHVRSSKG